MIIKDDHLYYILVQKEDLKEDETHRMYELMTSNYSGYTQNISRGPGQKTINRLNKRCV